MSEFAYNFDESIPGLNFSLNIEFRRLDSTPAQLHHRLADPVLRSNVRDDPVSKMTYGYIVRRIDTDESPDLPQGAARADDLESHLYLADAHFHDINRALDFDTIRKVPEHLAGFPVDEIVGEVQTSPEVKIGKLHPVVEGYKWLRGLDIRTDVSSRVLLFTPRLYPWQKEGGGAPYPALYTIGNVALQDLRAITGAYRQAIIDKSI